jgi:putative ABC transport system permease protein
MERLLQDVRYALRMLRRSPGFAIAAVLTLALGMGANTVMFSVLNTVLLRPLPYSHADQLVQIWETEPSRGENHGFVSAFDFLEWRNSQGFSEIATYNYNPLVLTGLNTPQRINAEFVSAGFFDVFKVSPIKGRTFRADEDSAGNARAVVLSFGAWSRYFERDTNITGETITLDDKVYTIVGVMPSDFAFPNENIEAWCLPGFDPQSVNRRRHNLSSVGRLKPGITLDQAQVEMNTIADNLNQGDGLSSGVRLVGLQDEIVGNVRLRLLVLWAAVLAVLLIACANVAGLLLARAVSRQKEVAIRMALGGSRQRLVRQFLTESVLLAGIGGILGVALSYAAGHFLISSAPSTVPRLRDFHLDGWVLGFTAFACLGTGLAFGIAPAMHALRLNLQTSLKQGGSAAQVSGRLRLRSLMVIGEFALATVLLIVGGLLTKTLWRLQHVDLGFQTENVFSFRFSVPDGRYDARQLSGLYQRVLERLAVIPGVEAVGATNNLPFAGSRTSTNFEVTGHPLAAGQVLLSDRRTVSSSYMQTMRMRTVAGREFTEGDGPGAPRVSIVNEAFVKKFLPGEEPLAQRLNFHSQSFQIVGVVADVKYENLAAPGDPEIYVPYNQDDLSKSIYVVLRTQSNIQGFPAAIRNAMEEVAPSEPIYRLNTMTQLIESSISPQKFSSLLLAVFAGLALLLSAIGIYGVIAYSVVQRTREIGIRMALGADRSNVMQLILGQGIWIGILGLTAGMAAAWLSTRVLSSMLFGVDPHDAGIFFVVLASLILVVMLASYVPARRATRVDPLVALRDE